MFPRFWSAILAALGFFLIVHPVSAQEYPVGTLLKCGRAPAVFYVASDGKRHQIPDEETFDTWYEDFSSLKKIRANECAKMKIGARVTVHPGTALVKFRGSRKVYAVSAPNVLHWVRTPSMASALYGSAWQKSMILLSARDFRDYKEGAPLATARDYDPSYVVFHSPDIDSMIVLLKSKQTGLLRESASPPPICDYPTPPQGCTYVKGSSYNPTTGCGMSLRCSVPTPDPAPAPVRPPIVPPPQPIPAPSPVPPPPVLPPAGGTPTPSVGAPPPPAAAGVGVSDAARIIRPTAFGQPAFNTRVTEPNFGTTIRRITDRVRTGAGGYATHDYSQLQAFSRDNQYVLLGEDGESVVRRVDTLARANDAGLDNTNAIRWQPALPHTLVHYDTNEDEVIRVQYTNVDTGRTDTVFTFPTNYARIRSNQSFDELSQNGKWMAGMATLANGGRMVFSLNMETRTLGAQVSVEGLFTGGPCARDPQYGILEPDWIGVSPLGKYIVVQWVRDGSTRCSGLETWDIQTGRYVGHLAEGHDHGDLGVDRDGTTEYFMTFDTASGIELPVNGIHILPGPATGVGPVRYLQSLNWGTQHHVSCQGPNGVCLVTAFLHNPDAPNEPWHPFDEELFLQYADGRILRLGHHRSSQCGYWVQPRASMSHDGRYVIFDSDWGVNRCAASNDNLGRGEVYLIELPAGLVSAGPSATNQRSSLPAGEGRSEVNPPPPPPPPATTGPALGTTGVLPQSTYMLRTGESITMDEAEGGATFYADPRMGAGTCFATDFISYEVYAAPVGSTNYKLYGRHMGADGGQFLTGSGVDTGGCAKDRLIYTLNLGLGTHTVALCITNIQNASQRVCRAAQVTL